MFWGGGLWNLDQSRIQGTYSPTPPLVLTLTLTDPNPASTQNPGPNQGKVSLFPRNLDWSWNSGWTEVDWKQKHVRAAAGEGAKEQHPRFPLHPFILHPFPSIFFVLAQVIC